VHEEHQAGLSKLARDRQPLGRSPAGAADYWTGEECRAFEREFAAWTGTTHAVSLGSGTLALDAVLKAWN
jgi:threonine aldolase